MVSSTLCPAVHILGSQNVYSRAEGIADHYWPWAVFCYYFSLTKNMTSFRDVRMLSQPPRSFIALSSSLLPPRFLLHFNNTKDCSFHSQTVNIVISSADESIMEQRSNRRTDKASYSDARTYLTMLLKATVIGSYGLPKPLGACITYHKSLSN